MNNIFKAYYKSPIGIIEVKGTNGYIFSVNFVDDYKEVKDIPEYINDCIIQLDEFFKGKRKDFSFNILMNGTEFRKKVWNELINIPYGETRSYKDIAIALHSPKSCRAVGNANHNNNLIIVVPCHRVIGTNGSLTGYAEGLWRKQWLLDHESNFKSLK